MRLNVNTHPGISFPSSPVKRLPKAIQKKLDERKKVLMPQDVEILSPLGLDIYVGVEHLIGTWNFDLYWA